MLTYLSRANSRLWWCDRLTVTLCLAFPRSSSTEQGCRTPVLTVSPWSWALLYVHGNRRLIRDGSPGRPPRPSHSSWALTVLPEALHYISGLTDTTPPPPPPPPHPSLGLPNQTDFLLSIVVFISGSFREKSPMHNFVLNTASAKSRIRL